ncbi:MAG: 28S ribosomal protein S21, mitochondrial, partial [Paramarteilia canceri]
DFLLVSNMRARCFALPLRFLMRTVLLRRPDLAVESTSSALEEKSSDSLDLALRRLQIIVEEELLVKISRRQIYRECISTIRNRVSHERCKRIYTREMNRKVSFVMKKNRFDPFLI